MARRDGGGGGDEVGGGAGREGPSGAAPPPPGRARLHVLFSGIVQGVFFRANTRREALRLGLQGWVRNLPDGRVEAWVEGERAAVEGLLDYCSSRIPMAQVDKVDFDWGSPTREHGTFEIVT